MATGAVVAAVIGVGATTAAVIAAGINMAIAFAASYLMAKKAQSGGTPSAADYKQTVQSDKSAQRVIYGRRQLSMVLNYVNEQDGLQEISDKTGESHELLYMSGMLCNHPVHSIGEVKLDDKLFSEYGDKAEVYHVNGTGSIPAILMEEGNQYESTMTGSNGYWAALKLTHDSTVFSGVPVLKVVIEGKKIKDFRTGQMVYSNNAALVLADFYINYMKIPESRLMMSGTGSFIDAANLCDENMPNGEKRYTINGMFELDAKPSDIINEMLKSCGGTLIRTNGLIGLLPAAYYGEVSPMVITESDIVGGLSITPQEALSECVNIISGTYVEEADDWSEQDFTPVRDEAAIARDGFEVAEDIDYTYVTNAIQAQRLVNIELRRRAAGGFTELKMSPKGAYCRVGRVISLDLPQLGLSGEFRVTSQTENEDLTFTIVMQRDDINIYDDAIGEPYSPPPLLELGGQDVAAPTGLQFVYSFNDSVGNVIQGALIWSNGSASTSFFNVLITDDNDNVIQAGDTKGFVFNVNAVPVGNYKGKVRAVDSRGRTSSYTVTSFSVGEPSTPAPFRSDLLPPDGNTYTLYSRSNWSIEIVPNIEGGVPQGTEFEFWHLADSESYITGQPSYTEADLTIAKLVATASSYNQAGLTPDRWQHYWVRSVNSYGKSDFIYLQTGTTKEQDLVTTVVERLEAIEIQSANWEPDETTGISPYGYKMFSPASDPVIMPDGTELENPDGLVVLKNLIAQGHITAETLTFVSPDSIPPEIDNRNVSVTSNLIDDAGFSNSFKADGVPSGFNYAYNPGDQNFTSRAKGDDWALDSTNYTGEISLASPPVGLPDRSSAVGDTVDIGGGERVGFSVYLGYHRVDLAGIKLVVTRSSGDTYEVENFNIDPAKPGGKTLSSYERLFVYADMPSDAVAVRPEIVKGDTAVGETSSFLFYVKPMLEIMKSDQTEPSDWVDGGLTPYDDSWIYPNQSSIQIKSDNYSPGSAGWAIDKNGNAEFRQVTVRGTIYGDSGWFNGTVFADKIVGDVVSAIRKSNSPQSANGYDAYFGGVTVRTSRPYDRTLTFQLHLKVVCPETSQQSMSGWAKVTGSFGSVNSISLEAKGGTGGFPNESSVTFTLNVPANTTGTVNIYVTGSGTGSSTISAPSTNNVWTAQLFKNGGDLG